MRCYEDHSLLKKGEYCPVCGTPAIEEDDTDRLREHDFEDEQSGRRTYEQESLREREY